MYAIKRLQRWLWFILALSAMLPMSMTAQANLPVVNAVLRSGTLSFVGHATLGDFVGTTSIVSGAVMGDVQNARGWVQAPVATLVTRNDHRDRDLRASMEVDQYPTMRFDLDRTSIVSALEESGDTLAMLLHGKLTIHGVTRQVELPARVSHGADTIHVTADFPLDMSDYHIGGLTKMLGLLRVQRQIEVRLDLRFVSVGSTSER